MKVYAVSIQWREKDLPWTQASLCPPIAHRWPRAGGLCILDLPSVSQWSTWHHQHRRAARNQPSHPDPQLNCEWSISCSWLYLESREKNGRGHTHTLPFSLFLSIQKLYLTSHIWAVSQFLETPLSSKFKSGIPQRQLPAASKMKVKPLTPETGNTMQWQVTYEQVPGSFPFPFLHFVSSGRVEI